MARKSPWRISACALVASGLASAVSPPALAQVAAAELIPYAVHVDRTPKQAWPGYGVYLGDGYVLTAAHVVGNAFETQPHVVVDGRALPTTVVKEGTFETNDLTLLRADLASLPARLQLRRLALCVVPPAPGQPVVVVIPEGTAPSHILPPQLLPLDVRARFPTVIADVATTGNSGSGVFDAWRGCLLGIMSRKIETISHSRDGMHTARRDLAKYFVPAAVIASFLPPTARF
jgi:S1-C subfamily serine protease